MFTSTGLMRTNDMEKWEGSSYDQYKLSRSCITHFMQVINVITISQIISKIDDNLIQRLCFRILLEWKIFFVQVVNLM